MRGLVIGSEAVAAGIVSRGALRWNYRAVHPDVYLHKDACRDLYALTVAAWLWTGRCGVISGQAAAALHGVTSVGDSAQVELIARHGRRRPGVLIRDERIGDDEVVRVGELPVTSPARTAIDLGRHLKRDTAVALVDALAAVAGLTADDVQSLMRRYGGARGIQTARVAAGLMDGGARNADETQLRLRLIDAGLPRPRTKIIVRDEFWQAAIAMGWEEAKVGVDCVCADTAGTDRYRLNQQIASEELFQRCGWMRFRIRPDQTATPAIRRVHTALRQRWQR